MEDLVSSPYTAAIAEGSGCCLLPHLFELEHSSEVSATSVFDVEVEPFRSAPSEEAAGGSHSDSETHPALLVQTVQQEAPPTTLRAAGGPCQHCGVKGAHLRPAPVVERTWT